MSVAGDETLAFPEGNAWEGAAWDDDMPPETYRGVLQVLAHAAEVDAVAEATIFSLEAALRERVGDWEVDVGHPLGGGGGGKPAADVEFVDDTNNADDATALLGGGGTAGPSQPLPVTVFQASASAFVAGADTQLRKRERGAEGGGAVEGKEKDDDGARKLLPVKVFQMGLAGVANAGVEASKRELAGGGGAGGNTELGPHTLVEWAALARTDAAALDAKTPLLLVQASMAEAASSQGDVDALVTFVGWTPADWADAATLRAKAAELTPLLRALKHRGLVELLRSTLLALMRSPAFRARLDAGRVAVLDEAAAAYDAA